MKMTMMIGFYPTKIVVDEMRTKYMYPLLSEH
jgi:hypothetical protein